MKAVITVTGRDVVGIIAKVSVKCAEYGANIVDISQSVLSEYFAMIMVVELSNLTIHFTDFVDILKKLGEEIEATYASYGVEASDAAKGLIDGTLTLEDVFLDGTFNFQ